MRPLPCAVLALGLALTAPVDAQTILDNLIKQVVRPRSATSAPAGQPAGRFVVAITPEQSAAIDRLLTQPLQDAAVAADRAEAAPLIKVLLATGSCALQPEAWNATNRFRLEPRNFGGFDPVLMRNGMTKYHDKARCMEVLRLTDWSKPARNALRFKASYVAEDSGEAGSQQFELQKGSDGQWLIRDLGSSI